MRRFRLTAGARWRRAGLLALAVIAAAALPGPVAAQERKDPPQGRFLGSLVVTARPVDVLDANNPAVLDALRSRLSERDAERVGDVLDIFRSRLGSALSERDIASLDIHVSGRAGTVADGTSALLLRMRVAPGGRLNCEVEGGASNGRCQALALQPSARVEGAAVVAAIYLPPARFDTGAGPVPRRYRQAVETREVAIRLTYQWGGAAPLTGTRRILLAHPPLVLVHGTFDSATVWRIGGSGPASG